MRNIRNCVWAKQLVLLLCLVIILCGCQKKEAKEPPVDAKGFVRITLDCFFKGETEAYAKFLDISKEEAQQEYEAEIDSVLKEANLAEVFPEGLTGDFRGEIVKLLALAKYEVKDSKKEANGNYEVTVAASPSDFYPVFFSQFPSYLSAAMQGAYSDEQAVLNAMTQMWESALQKQTYGEPIEMKVGITKGEDNNYNLNEEDLTALMSSLFVIPENIIEPSGTVYNSPYLNWVYAEWTAASDEEKTNSCLASLQFLTDLPEDQMALIKEGLAGNAELLQAVEEMKTGIEMSLSSSPKLSIGDFISMLKNATPPA